MDIHPHCGKEPCILPSLHIKNTCITSSMTSICQLLYLMHSQALHTRHWWPLISKTPYGWKWLKSSLRFSLELWGLRDQVAMEVSLDEIPTWSPTWHAIIIVSWSTRFCIRPTSKMDLTQTGRPWHFKISQSLVFYKLLCGRAHMIRMILHSVESPVACLHTTLGMPLTTQKLNSKKSMAAFA